MHPTNTLISMYPTEMKTHVHKKVYINVHSRCLSTYS